jgi:hypothetical protein
MNTIFGLICAAISLLSFSVCTHLLFHRRGYQSGVKDGYAQGYEAGKRDEGNWWLRLEYETLEARKEIWREEAER